MTIEQIRYFCAVAQLKNISRAAQSMFISTSAMSRHIANLEESLGVQLITRGGRSLELTPAGQYVLERGPSLLASIDSFQDSVRQVDQEYNYSIIVACVPLYQDRLFETLRCFNEEAYATKLMIRPVHSWEVLSAVANSEAHLGITYDFELPTDISSSLRFSPILQDYFALLVDKDHPLAKLDHISIKEISDWPLLSAKRPIDPNTNFLLRLGEHHSKPSSGHAMDWPTNAAFQVRARNGIAVFPRTICENYRDGCAIIPIQEEDASTKLIAVWRKDNDNKALLQLTQELENLYQTYKTPCCQS